MTNQPTGRGSGAWVTLDARRRRTAIDSGEVKCEGVAVDCVICRDRRLAAWLLLYIASGHSAI